MAQIDKRNIGVLDRKKSEFDLSHSINTTGDFGHVQTLLCEYIPLGDTTLSCKVNNFMRVSPLVAPTFGEIRSRNYFQYVKSSDIYPFVSQVLAGTPVYLSNEESTSTDSSYVIENLPCIDNYILSLMALKYMSVKVFYPTYQSTSSGYEFKGFRQLSRSEYETNRRNILIDVTSGAWEGDYAIDSPALTEFIGTNFTYIEHDDSVLNGITENVDASLSPFNCEVAMSFVRDIIPDGGVEPLVENKVCFICFYHTRKSKTLWKHLVGCGYKLNFGIKDNYVVSLMPLLATAKAYFDIFNLVQYENYYESILYKIYEFYSHNAPYFCRNYYDVNSSEYPLIRQLFDYLTETVYRATEDYLSAHQPLTTTNDMASLPAAPSWNDVSDLKYVNLPHHHANNYDQSEVDTVDLQPAISNVARSQLLTHLDIELLQKMYLWVNRQSQCGYDVRNILVSRGYSQFCENTDSQFLGQDVNIVNINDVMSTSDTFDSATKTGAVLGDMTGYAKGGNEGKNIKFTANEVGYFVCLNVIIPNTGYVGSLKPSVLGYNKWNLYNPEFDGFGYEWSPSAVVGRVDQFYNTSGAMGSRPMYDASVFGLIPRMSGYKVHADVANGDMINFQFRDNFSPYYLERIFSHTRLIGSKMDNGRWKIDDQASQAPLIPSAGAVWRESVTQQFMGNYNRIFRVFDGITSEIDYYGVPREDFYLPIDEFISHNYVNFKIWSRMLPIMDTFQTEETQGEGKHITVEH